jgi:hypothetical protein
MIEQDMSQIITRYMPLACWITEATNTQQQYAIRSAFQRHYRLLEPASILRYAYIACLIQ